MIAEKQLARQDTDFAINPGNNNETSIKITEEISNILLDSKPIEDKGKIKITFYIYKEDFIKSACGIISSLPLLDKHGHPISFSIDFCNEMLSKIDTYFGDEIKKLYSTELLYNTSRSSYIQGFDKSFNIRSYTVESWSTIRFTKEDNGYACMRLLFSNKSNDIIKNEREGKYVPYQEIFYGAPGTGKSYTIKEQTEMKDVIRTTFHPDTDYSTFVGTYKPTMKRMPIYNERGQIVRMGNKEQIAYEFVPQAFLQAYVKAWKKFDKVKKVANAEEEYLVIEEINRGNCAQIFGDLFQLLDRGDSGFSEYPIKTDADMKKYLQKTLKNVSLEGISNTINKMFKDKNVAEQVKEGDILLLPCNLYIWATMNTSDQSLFPIDSAFKRRWDWQYVPISDVGENWVISVNGKDYSWWGFLEEINKRIYKATYSEDKKLGYFFCKANGDGVIDADKFVSKVIFYLWNDVFKDTEFEGDTFKDGNNGKLTFDKFYKVEDKKTKVVSEKVELFLNNLGLRSEDVEEDEDGNTKESSSRNYDKFTINGGKEYGKNRLAIECIKKFITLNPAMSAQEVYETWKQLAIGVPHFIEKKAEYESRNSNKRSNKIDCNGEELYVALNGYGNNGKADELMNKVNEKGWGITIEKIVK